MRRAGRGVRATVFDATDRRSYEDELLRARRQEQETAQQLSRSLLAGSLPTAPGLEVEVAYRPAASGLEVGGDWYDAFWLDGLIERRSGSLTDGLDRLLRVAATHGDDTAAGLTAAVVRALHDPGHVDDVCVLAVRLA